MSDIITIPQFGTFPSGLMKLGQEEVEQGVRADRVVVGMPSDAYIYAMWRGVGVSQGLEGMLTTILFRYSHEALAIPLAEGLTAKKVMAQIVVLAGGCSMGAPTYSFQPTLNEHHPVGREDVAHEACVRLVKKHTKTFESECARLGIPSETMEIHGGIDKLTDAVNDSAIRGGDCAPDFVQNIEPAAGEGKTRMHCFSVHPSWVSEWWLEKRRVT